MPRIKEKTVYRCVVCGAEYDSKKVADTYCGSYKLEPQKFRAGQLVTVWYRGKNRRAMIVKRLRPMVGRFVISEKNGRRYSEEGHVQRYALKPTAKRTNVTMNAFYFLTSQIGWRSPKEMQA